MGLFSWLRSHGDSGPTDIEAELVLQVAALLPDELADRLRARLAAINFVEHDAGRTVLRQMDGIEPLYPPETALIDHPGTVRFAEVRTLSRHAPSRLCAVLHLHEGNLSAIRFDHPVGDARLDAISEFQPRLLGPPFTEIGLTTGPRTATLI